MKIYCEDASIFEDATARRELQRLFLRVADGQHTLIITDLDAFSRSAFAESAAEIDRREWEDILQRTLYANDLEDREEDPGSRPMGVHASVGRTREPRTAACRYPVVVGEVGDWAEQPLRLLLENDRDFALIEAAAAAYGSPSIAEAHRKKWLVVDGRGGCGEVLNRLRRRHEHERLFAFVDQDPDPSTGRMSSTAKGISDCCQENPPVPFHITRKHEIENYVPEAVLALRVFSGRKSSVKRAKRPRADTNHARFLEWQKLPDGTKDTDDLKKRFGKSLMESAIQDLRDPERCKPEDFRARARTAGVEELAVVLTAMVAHL
jgi:hypothetical protein